MTMPERSKYCVFYPGKEGELVIRENVGVDDLGDIFKEAEASSQGNEVFAFNMKGISQISDIAAHPENTYNLITIKEGQLHLIEDISLEAESLIQEAEHYYIVDDVYAVSDTALRQLIKPR